MPTGKRPTDEIADYIGKVTFVPNLSCLFSARTSVIYLISLIFPKALKNPNNGIRVIVPPFDGESYDLWAVRMQTYLEGLDL